MSLAQPQLILMLEQAGSQLILKALGPFQSEHKQILVLLTSEQALALEILQLEVLLQLKLNSMRSWLMLMLDQADFL